jgi:hypothetical protein
MKAKLEALAALIADYREGEVAKPDADHVERWLRQFDADEREPLLDELLRIWPAFYLNLDNSSGSADMAQTPDQT